MIEIPVPGYKTLQIRHLVMDYNGTIAFDGKLIPGVDSLIHRLAEKLALHVVTADTFGSVADQMKNLPSKLHILSQGNQDAAKLEYVRKLGSENTACIGNGRNDCLMLKESVLGIAVVQDEGAAPQTIFSADVVCTSIITSLELFLHPQRLIAALRT